MLIRSNLKNIIKVVNDNDEIANLKAIVKALKDEDIDFEREITVSKYANEFAKDSKEYIDYVKNSNEFKVANTIIKRMLQSPNLDKALGFTTPTLKLDPNVCDFYDFKSPKMRTGKNIEVVDGKIKREGKIVNNPESSFEVENYHPELEGTEIGKVPVAI